jgi:hypothetical protein
VAGKEGFWRVGYGNEAGGGWAVIVLDTGVVVGADSWGGMWDGVYEFDPRTNEIDMELSVVFPPQVFSAVTGQASVRGHKETYSFALPNDFGREIPFEVTIQGRPLAVRFQKIRDFPQ